jgi:transcriptional regulator with XRE-family HTH domain
MAIFKNVSNLIKIPKDNKIRELRHKYGFSQKYIAEKLNVSQNTIQCWQCGKSQINIRYIEALCEIFNVSTNYLLGLPDESNIFREFQSNMIETIKKRNKYNSQNRFKFLRTQMELTQKQLADIVGVDVSIISYWEHGLCEIDEDSLALLAKCFNVTPEYILGN